MGLLNGIIVRFSCCLRNSKGQTIIEYALIIALIAIVVMAMFTGIGQNTNKAFSTINSTLS
jgi:pilus assembly protein Flp/PilA